MNIKNILMLSVLAHCFVHLNAMDESKGSDGSRAARGVLGGRMIREIPISPLAKREVDAMAARAGKLLARSAEAQEQAELASCVKRY